MSSERRHFARVAFNAAAQLSTAEARDEVRVLDLSFKGALVEVPSGWTVAIGMSGEVAHIEGRRVGLLCRSIDLDSVTHLRALIELNLGDEALLERELKALVTS